MVIFFLVRIAFRSLGAATKATVDAASGKKLAESFSDNFSGFGDFKFKVEKQQALKVENHLIICNAIQRFFHQI